MIPACKDIDHQIYKRVDSASEADGLAWVFKNAKEFVPYYFKFPELKADEVRAKVLHTGLCHSDSMTGRECWGPCSFPLCAGHEVIAQVTQVGADVKNVKVGQVVGYGPLRKACFECKYCKKGENNLCCGLPVPERLLYGQYFGGYATHIQQPACHAIPIPAGMDITTAPPLLCAGATVFSPMQRFIKDKSAKVGVIGIGGLGHLAVQFGHAMGNYVAGFTTSKDKVDYIKKLGADEVIVIDKEGKEFANHQDKFDFLVNTLPVSSPELLEGYMSTLTSNGTLIQVGAPDINTKMAFSFMLLIMKQIKVVGSAVGSTEETAHMLQFAHDHHVKVEAEKFSFEDFPKALDRLENGRPQFRCVVNVEDYNKQHFPSK